MLFSKTFSFKIMLFKKNFFFELVLFKIIFFFKIMFFRKKTFFFKIVLFEIGRKTQILRILRGEMNQKVIFCVQKFFKICFLKSCFSSKSCFLKLIFSSKSCFLKIFFFYKIVLFKNIFLFKIWRAIKLLIQNLTSQIISPNIDFYLVFQVPNEWWYLLPLLIPRRKFKDNACNI